MTPDPLFLTTAIEAVVHAGDVMMSRFGTPVRVDKKGTIDLVTEVDVAIERSFRAMIATRFPGHAVLGEEMGGSAAPPSVSEGSPAGCRQSRESRVPLAAGDDAVRFSTPLCRRSRKPLAQ